MREEGGEEGVGWEESAWGGVGGEGIVSEKEMRVERLRTAKTGADSAALGVVGMAILVRRFEAGEASPSVLA